MSGNHPPVVAVGDLFHHYTLGECQVREIHEDGSITVCSAEVRNNTNMFRLRRPSHPGNWVAYREH